MHKFLTWGGDLHVSNKFGWGWGIGCFENLRGYLVPLKKINIKYSQLPHDITFLTTLAVNNHVNMLNIEN